MKGLVFLKYRNQYVPPIALAHRWLMREWAVLPKNGKYTVVFERELFRGGRANCSLLVDA